MSVIPHNMGVMFRDSISERINYRAAAPKIVALPFPAASAPKAHRARKTLGAADVLIVTWTAAEKDMLAQVLLPEHPYDNWQRYVVDWSEYLPQLTGRSPANYSKELGRFAYVNIGDKTVALFGSDLHLSTDGVTMPIVQLWKQLIAAVKPEAIITTGTAGGIGADCSLGDVVVTNGAKFNCASGQWKDAAFAQQTFISSGDWQPGPSLEIVENDLLPLNAAKLAPVATRTPEVRDIIGSPGVETIPFFGFADYNDAYGIVANCPTAGTEEMDDATLPLALDQLGSEIPWLSIRNASDPQVPDVGNLTAQDKWAAAIYEKYGPYTTIGSAAASWGMVADL